jgi:outer membrane protein OmpA-like peptidoglycan-associated protein
LNLRIGLSRALTVRSYLIKKGIDPSCISIDTKGKDNPILPNTSYSRPVNRRVEVRAKP